MSDIEEEEQEWVSESLWRHEPVGAGCLQPGPLLPFRAKLRFLHLNARSSRWIRWAPDVSGDVPTLLKQQDADRTEGMRFCSSSKRCRTVCFQAPAELWSAVITIRRNLPL